MAKKKDDMWYPTYEELMGIEEPDRDDDIPEGCVACGGPYPDCMTSCSIFDD